MIDEQWLNALNDAYNNYIPYSLVFKRMRLFEKQQEICA